MLLAILGAGVGEGLDPRNVDDYLTFVTAGIVVMTALFSSTFSSASYYQDRDSGMLRMVFASPHPPRVALAAKIAGAAIIGIVQALIVLGAAAAVPAVNFSWEHGAMSVAVVLAVVLLLNLLLAGIGQFLAARIATMQGFHLVMNLVMFPFLFFSGAFFPIEDLPAWLKVLAWVNPLSYAVDALQLTLYGEDGTGYFGLAVDLPVLAALAAVLVYAGTARGGELDR
jgi:ABC-2 type transport system permease protein